MKKQKWTLICFLLLSQSVVAAEEQKIEASGNTQVIGSPLSGGYSVNATYSYSDFEFNSHNAFGSNRFKGHTNFYAVGGNDIKLSERFSGGFSAYWIGSDFHSRLALDSLPPVDADQSISTTTVYGHLLARVQDYFFVDVALGYGQNNGRYTTTMALPQFEKNGHANTRGHNWFASAAALFSKRWEKFNLNANVAYLYTEISQKPHNIYFRELLAPQPVDKLENKVAFLMENAELGYELTPMIQPFVNGGLLQVTSFKNSRSMMPIGFIGPIPALNLDMDGFKVGGGLILNHKQYSLRLEQQYFKRSSVYHSNQTILSLRANLE